MKIFNKIKNKLSPTEVRWIAICILVGIIIICVSALIGNTSISLDKRDSKFSDDTTQVWALVDKAGMYLEGKPDSTFFYAKEAIEIAKEANFKLGEGVGYGTLGLAQFKLAKYEDAKMSYLKASDIFLQSNEKRNYLNAQILLGTIYTHTGESYEAFRISIPIVDSVVKLNDTGLLISLKINIAESYLQMKYNKEARPLYEEVIDLANAKQNVKALAIGFRGLSKTYYIQRHYDSTLKYVWLAIKMATLANDSGEIARSYNGFATVLQDQLKIDSALFYFIKAREISERVKDERTILTIYTNIARLYESVNDTISAQHFCDSALTLSKEIENLPMQKEALQIQSQIDELKGDFKAALIHMREANSVDSTNASEEKIKLFNSAKKDFEYDLERKANEVRNNALLEKQIREYYIQFMTIACMILVACLILSDFLFRTKKKLYPVVIKPLIMLLVVAFTVTLNLITGKFFSNVFGNHPIVMVAILIIDYYLISTLHKILIKYLTSQKVKDDEKVIKSIE